MLLNSRATQKSFCRPVQRVNTAFPQPKAGTQLLHSGKLGMHVFVTEMEEVSSKSTRTSVSTVSVSAFQPKPLSKSKSWGAAVLSRIGPSTAVGKGSMEAELEGTHVNGPLLSNESDHQKAAVQRRATARLETATKRFLLTVTGREKLDELREKSWSWYIKHLQRKLIPLWGTLLLPTLAGLNMGQKPDDISAKAETLNVFRKVAGSLFGYGEVTLPDIVDQLR